MPFLPAARGPKLTMAILPTQLVGLPRPVALAWRRWLARLDGAPVDLDGDGGSGGGARSGGGGGGGAATDDRLRRFLRHLRPLPSRLAGSFAARPDAAAMDLLASLLAVEPGQRCTCAQALGHDFFR